MSGQAAPRAEQFVLVIFTCAAVAAFGSAFNQPAAWVFWLPAILSPFWRFKSLPRGLIKWARYLAWAQLGLTVALGLVLMAYPPLLSEQATRWLTLISGYGLGLWASVFLLGTSLWNPAETVIPAATGLTVVASFNSLAVITPLLATPGAAAFAYLLLAKRVRWGQMFSWRLALSALAAALIAAAFYFELPRLQQQVEATTMKWVMGGTGSANPFGTQSQLGDLQRLQLSRRVVLRVWTPRPQKLRARVFGRFDGRTWQAMVSVGTLLRAAPGGSPGTWLNDVPGNSFLFPRGDGGLPAAATPTRIVQSVATPGVLATPPNKLLVRVSLPSLRADTLDNLILPLTSQVSIFGVVNLPGAEDTEAGPPDSQEDYLAVPRDLDSRWTALAMQLAAGTSSTEERVTRTIDYVKHAAQYSLEVGEFRTRQPVTEFFFEKKRGYCQYFATAAALLLRLEGIPARYVTGYVVQEFNPPGGYYVVRDADAHAWVEVLVKGKGWVEADPTPEAEFEARREANSSGRLAEYVEWLAALAAETWVLLGQRDWRDAFVNLRRALKSVFPAALFLIVFLLGIAAALRWMLGRRHRSVRVITHRPPAETSEGEPHLQRVRETLERSWKEVGLGRPPSQGLLEHLEGILPEKVSAEFLELSRRLASAYYHLSFGAQKPSSDDLGELDRLSTQLASEARRTLKAGER